MIVYSATKAEFCTDVTNNCIERKILEVFTKRLGQSTSKAEVRSWQNSMMYMGNILIDPSIPSDSIVSIEYRVPQTSKRIDFILSGKNEKKEDSLVIVELKQWEEVTKTDLDGIVVSYVGKAEREVSHPSYQAWSYAALLSDFNSVVQDKEIKLNPCAYLHNSHARNVLLDPFYKEHYEKAPVFLRDDASKLRDFIKTHIKSGDKDEIMYQIDQGKIRPSKSLADALESMLKGNREFLMIDDQKLVYETARSLAKSSSAKNKNVLIVEGGPGSGKSVVAINLLVNLIGEGLLAKYVTKNSAPREVYEKLLTGSFRKSRISSLFGGSGSYSETEANTFDVLIVDEAHRLNAKSGIYSNIGENQVKELIHSSQLSIFFIDENQQVTFKDIGSKAEIRKWAAKLGAKVSELELSSQFRCNGSDGYISWLDHYLQLKVTANDSLKGIDYDFKVYDCPHQMREDLRRIQQTNSKSRIVAGYCWKWPKAKRPDPNHFDIEINGDFKMKWNLEAHKQSWLIQPDSFEQAGCIHTCQGLELDYVGVIIGPDLIVRNGIVMTAPEKRASTDTSLKGYKQMLKENRDLARETADTIIRNTYRTLMTRGMKGCYIYCTDEETRQYFKAALEDFDEQN